VSLPTSNGIPYLPDGFSPTEPPPRPWPTWIRIVIFVICYATLQALYAGCGGTVVENFFLERAGSRPAAVLIGMLQPTLNARAVGARVTAPGGGAINIGNGCEGTDLYFLLFAAFAAASLSLRLRGIGLGIGLILAFILNQVRIIALFLAYRSDRALFDLLHTTAAPVFLVVALALYFHAWLHYSQRPATAAA
jgi:exosortase/archaeosortase family protein